MTYKENEIFQFIDAPTYFLRVVVFNTATKNFSILQMGEIIQMKHL